jgi:hypothetical protein
MKRPITVRAVCLTLLALLGVTLGVTTLASSANASRVYLYPPSDSSG